MKFESNNFLIEYDEKDELLINEITKNLESISKPILNFFEIKKLSKKLNIIIYHDLQDFINFRTKNGKYPQRYKSWNVASAEMGNVHILSLELYKQADNHHNCDFNDYLKTITHEFVHVCHEEILLNKNIMPALIMEGIATQLAKQPYYINHIDCTAEELTKNFYQIKNCYRYAHTIMGYMLKNKSHNEILKILREPHKVDVDSLIKETNNFLKESEPVQIKVK